MDDDGSLIITDDEVRTMSTNDKVQIHHTVNLSIGHRKLYYRCTYGKIDAYIRVCIPWTTVTSGLGYIGACMFSVEKENKCDTIYVPDDDLNTSIISKELVDLIV